MTTNSHEIPLPDEVEDTLNAWKKKNKQKQKKKEEEKEELEGKKITFTSDSGGQNVKHKS